MIKKDESSEDQETKFISYITRQLKKFIKNTNVKENDKDHKQSVFSQVKSQDKVKREFKVARQNSTILARPKCYRCQGYGPMKQECHMYLKFIGKSKALATILSDTKFKIDSNDSDQEGIVSAFIVTIGSPKGAEELVSEEKELVESKFEKNG